MKEQEVIEKEELPFFSMEDGNVIYEIHLDLSQPDSPHPFGVIKIKQDDAKEVSFEVEVEEIIVNMIKFFGNKKTISQRDISYFFDRNEKGKREINFFGSFGDIKIDEVSNLVYNANP